MLFMSWRRWPDVLVDFGWELYAPWQISKGMVLYKGIKSAAMGSLSLHINAALFKIFGVGLTTIAYFNILIISILTLLVYRIFLKTTDRLSATVTCAVFLGIFAFSQYVGTGNYNFVCPYSQQLIHGIFLSFLAVYIFDIYQKNMSGSLLFLEGIVMGLIFLARIEVFIAAFTAITAGMSFLIFIRKPVMQNIFKMLGIFWAGSLLPVLGFTIYLAKYMPFWDAFDSITIWYRELFSSPVVSNVFYRRIMGTDSPLPNVLMTVSTGLKYLAALLIIAAAGKILSMIRDKRLKAAAAFAFLAIIYILALPFINKIFWAQIFRGIPVVIIALGTYFCLSVLRFKNNTAKVRPNLTLLVMAVFSFMILIKMMLNVHVYHYGFALAMPGTLLSAACLVRYTPMFLRNKSFEAFFVRSLTVMIVGVIIIGHIAFCKKIYDLKRYAVGAGPDTILTYTTNISPIGACVNAAVERIQKLVKEDETLLVLPEGIILNYLSRRANPFCYISFMPFQQEVIGEDKALSSMITCSPDYIAITDRDTSEFGYKGFGVDYGVNVFAWIKENYKPLEKITGVSDAGWEFNIIISKRMKTKG
jgi:hypothetical protein